MFEGAVNISVLGSFSDIFIAQVNIEILDRLKSGVLFFFG